MLGEQDLFGNDNGAAHARRSDPDTSHEAALGISGRVSEVQRAVLDYAATVGAAGFIDPDLAAHFGNSSSTYRSRRAELVGLGLIHDTGARKTVGEKGRRFAVWRITDKGRAEALRQGFACLGLAA